MATTPLLDLKTQAETAVIEIDGSQYPLLSAMQLPLAPYMRTESRSAQLYALIEKTDRTADDDATMSRLMDQCCRDVLGAPDEVHAKLTDVQRLAVLNVFGQLRSHGTTTGATRPTTSRQIGANGSRGSGGSTAAARRNGRKKSRSIG
jgi:hypothetical protein